MNFELENVKPFPIPNFEHTPNTSENDSSSSSDSDDDEPSEKRAKTSAIQEIIEEGEENIVETRLRERPPTN